MPYHVHFTQVTYTYHFRTSRSQAWKAAVAGLQQLLPSIRPFLCGHCLCKQLGRRSLPSGLPVTVVSLGNRVDQATRLVCLVCLQYVHAISAAYHPMQALL